MNRNTEDVNEDGYEAQSRKKPINILRHFSLILRFQRLCMSSKTVESMTCHHDQRTDDGLLRHLADSLGWKSFDSKFPSFASDPRSVRLGLTSDGFSPYKIMRTSYTLLWTINDFPTYVNLSGWSTKGRYACPCCAAQTCSKWLYNGNKFSYMGHYRWLDGNHRFKFQRTLFDSTEEFKEAPEQTIGSEILFMLKDINFNYGTMNQPPNTQTKRRSSDESEEEGDPNEADLWKKIFFLSCLIGSITFYYTILMSCILRKMFGENIIGTILNVDGKLKDNLQSRLALVDMGIRRDLYPQVLLNGKYRLSPSIFAILKEEKEVFCMVLKDIKVPDVYASNISRCVSLKDRRLYSLKSHDYHILMQDLLPVTLRCCMSKKVTSCIIELSNIMKAICGKVLNVEELKKVQDRATLTLCNLEKIFSPSFFTIMVHLLIHIPREAILGGLIFY
ncbi:hypothetical protein CXB51_027994 [Gossypium anomalum]|uniref:DUF4218 domain-containing protein n=1 Tax=Gossypium anomalum TaxID=47600 RepID=A0A8J5YGQ7_9ROSI|nr:hypothetical protein CXB51_027994 [Gossypium anomalum]